MTKTRIYVVCLALALLPWRAPSLAYGSGAQQPDAQDAAELYASAKKDLKKGSYSKALEKAEAVIAVEPEYAPAYLVRGEALRGVFTDTMKHKSLRDPQLPNKFQLLTRAVESFEQYLKLLPQAEDADYWRGEVQFLRPFAELGDKGASANRTLFLPAEVTQKLRILERPEPAYPDEARKAQVNGTVLLLVIFGADGKVGNILIINPLSHGVTESAIEAVRRIKFVPAMRDGQPVSQLIQIEYNFSTY